MSSIDVYQESDGRWRWEYRDGEVDLKSNRTYGDADSAVRAARTAYPDQFKDPTARSPRAARGLVHKLSLLMAVLLAVTVWRRRQGATN
ncbi:MAG: hypothetical protein QOH48_230 [Actinomycetota bacterium]|jgi:hypothetical protein|nr:hypothetical protein [Actinomycetota bacterium]